MKNIYAIIRKRSQYWVISRLVVIGVLLFSMMYFISEKNWRPLKQRHFKNVTSNYNQAATSHLIDQNIGTLWSSYAPITSGMYLQVNLRESAIMNGIVFHIDPEHHEPGLGIMLKGSVDGTAWQTIFATKRVVHRSVEALFFPPQRLSHLQIIQTSISSRNTPWTIRELILMRPIIPWHFDRAFVFSLSVGLLIIIISLTGSSILFKGHDTLSNPGRPRFHGFVFSLMPLVLLLVGWFLRVGDLSAYEPTLQEIHYVPILDFQSTDHLAWLQNYIEYSRTGASWLILLCARWAYAWLQDPRLALRMVPAIAGIGLAFLVMFLWPMIAKRTGSSPAFWPQSNPAPMWEALLAGGLLSVSGYGLWLSRRADFSPVFLLVFVTYTGMCHAVLYHRRPHLVVWPILAVGYSVGYCLTPLTILLPIPILITFCLDHLFSPANDRQFPRRTHRQWLLRLCCYGASLLPAWGGLYFWPGKRPSLPAFIGYQPGIEHFGQALELSGLSEGMSAAWWGCMAIGFVALFRSGDSREWRLYAPICFSALLLGGFSASPFPSVLLMFLLWLFMAKGVTVVIEWANRRWLNLASDSPSSAVIHLFAVLLTTAYFAVFAANSLFGGQPNLPYAETMYSRYAAEKEQHERLREVEFSSNACRTLTTLENDVAETYSATYHITSEKMHLENLKMVVPATGQFPSLLILSQRLDPEDDAELSALLNTYYHLESRSPNARFYHLQEPFRQHPRRFPAAHFYTEIGKLRPDGNSSSHNVLSGTTNDPPGLLVSWPTIQICTNGRYIARFAIQADDFVEEREDVLVRLDILTNRQELLARRTITRHDVREDGEAYQIFEVPFTIKAENPAFQSNRLLFLVYVTGNADISLDYIELLPPKGIY